MQAGLPQLSLFASLAALAGCAALPDKMPLASNQSEEKSPASKFESSLSLARLSERQGQTDNARQVYEAIIQSAPDNALARHRLGVIAARQRQFAAAEEHFQKALATGPSNPELLADVGYLYYLQDRLPEAEQMLRQSLELAPNSQSVQTNLALVLGEQGRLDEAYAEFLRSGDEAVARANLGYVCTVLGDFERAEKEYHLALTLNPKLRPAGEALSQLGQRRRAMRSHESRQLAAKTPSAQAPDSRSPHRLPGVEQPDPFIFSVTDGPPALFPAAARPMRPMAEAAPIPPASQMPASTPAPETQDQGVRQASFTTPDAGHAPRGFPANHSPWTRPTWTAPVAAP